MSKLVEVKNLKKYFKSPRGTVHATDDVTFCIEQGKTMGIVGESGCGKSTLGRMLVHLEESTGGQIIFNNEDVTQLSKKGLKEYHSHAQMIFQDPYSSLDPRYTIEDAIREPLMISGKYNRMQAQKKTEELMDLVGIARRLRMAYPHELDGGRRQRVGIARALALDPEFVVCDEPVSALDVSIQAQILNLLMDLQDNFGLTYMFITHDLSVVKHISNEIMVMYMGKCVERAPKAELFEHPKHPYTKALLSAIPEPNLKKKSEIQVLKGEVTSPVDPKPGCRFAHRCPHAAPQCFEQEQPLVPVGEKHFVACSRVAEGV